MQEGTTNTQHPLYTLQEAESAQRQYVQLRREHEALQNSINRQVWWANAAGAAVTAARLCVCNGQLSTPDVQGGPCIASKCQAGSCWRAGANLNISLQPLTHTSTSVHPCVCWPCCAAHMSLQELQRGSELSELRVQLAAAQQTLSSKLDALETSQGAGCVADTQHSTAQSVPRADPPGAAHTALAVHSVDCSTVEMKLLL